MPVVPSPFTALVDGTAASPLRSKWFKRLKKTRRRYLLDRKKEKRNLFGFFLWHRWGRGVLGKKIITCRGGGGEWGGPFMSKRDTKYQLYHLPPSTAILTKLTDVEPVICNSLICFQTENVYRTMTTLGPYSRDHSCI